MGDVLPAAGGKFPSLSSTMCDVEPAFPARRDLKLAAGELAHLLTHKPANPHCLSCTRGKLRQVPHRSGAFQRPVESWGDLITCDHMVQGDTDWAAGCDGSRHIFVIKDVATGIKMCYPMPSKSADATIDAFNSFVGRWSVGIVYSDCSEEIAAACKHRKFIHE